MWLTGATCLVAASAIGFAIGWPTGLVGLDSEVLAAVLPAILTAVAGGAGTLVFRRLKEEDSDTNTRLIRVSGGSVALFSVLFVAGTVVGDFSNKRGSVDELNQVLVANEKILEQRIDYARRCMEEWARLNHIRDQASASVDTLQLEPLRLDQVCIAIKGRKGEEIPLVSILEGTNIVHISRLVERKHYKYLEECTFKQVQDIVARKNNKGNNQADRTIEDVCPDLGIKHWASHP